MPATDRPYDRGTRLGERRLRDLGEEFRHKRLELGLSQLEVARAARISRSTYSRAERGKSVGLKVIRATRLGAILGLDVAVRAYPGGQPLRDAASARLIRFVGSHVTSPLHFKTEVPLPQRADAVEQRRWDVMLTGSGRRTGIEFETRLYDSQAQHGKWNLKLRDDPVDTFVVVLADTRRNRQVVRNFEGLFADLPRMSAATFLTALRNGEHPPTGLVLIPNVQPVHHPDETPPTKLRADGQVGDSVSDPAQE